METLCILLVLLAVARTLGELAVRSANGRWWANSSAASWRE